MSKSTQVSIILTDTGGHASTPELVKYSMERAIIFYVNIMNFTAEL